MYKPLQIKFSSDYNKLPRNWEGDMAVLLGLSHIEDFDSIRSMAMNFVEYDTQFYNSNESYPIGFREAIILFFWDITKGKLFTTIRRYTPEKFKYYSSNFGQLFEMVRVEPK